MIDKKLELAVNFVSAPKEIQDAAMKLRNAYAAQEKALAQKDLWSEAEVVSGRLVNQAQNEFNKLLGAWDPLNTANETKEAATGIAVKP